MAELFAVRAEQKEKPRYRLMITRHAERLPSGELSPEGIQHAQEKGKALASAEVVKGYASNHPSGRAFDTAELIGSQSETMSVETGERYQTRQVVDIQYDILKPDLSKVLAETRLIIEEATIQEVNSDQPELAAKIDAAIHQETGKTMVKFDLHGKFMPDLEQLPKEIQQEVAPIRQKNQAVGFRYMLSKPEVVHRMALGLAHQLVNKQSLMDRYAARRSSAGKPPTGDVVVNVATHGMFMESLLREAGIFVRQDGSEEHGISDFENAEFGGFIQPIESIYLELEDPHNLPERIPVSFDGGSRPQGRVFVDKAKLIALSQGYDALRKVSA